MKTLLEQFRDQIDKAGCSQCERTNDDLYTFDGEIWCHSCLSETEYEESERGLTVAERNE